LIEAGSGVVMAAYFAALNRVAVAIIGAHSGVSSGSSGKIPRPFHTTR
jgi:hypothetical protein